MLEPKHLRHLATAIKCSVIMMICLLLTSSDITLADDYQNIITSAECCKPSSNNSDSPKDELSVEEVLEIQKQNCYDRNNISEEFEDFEETHKDEIYLLAAIIASEAGCVDQEPWCSQAFEAGITPDIWQQYVGYCVMNRVYQCRYPNTIEDVFYQEGQYAETSLQSVQSGYVTERCINNATIVLENYYNNTIPVPRNMVYQAEFQQGSKVFLQVGNTCFCLQENLPAE